MSHRFARHFALLALVSALVSALAACGDDDAPLPGIDATVDDAGAADAGPGFDAASPPPDAGPPIDGTPWKGPWALRIDTAHATVRWETRATPADVSVVVRAESGAGAARTVTGTSVASEVTTGFGVGSPIVPMPDYPGTYYMNEVSIDALAPATCYTYEITGYADSGGRFCTMHEPTDRSTIRFLVIGDTNPAFGHTEPLIAPIRARAELPELVIHAGDIQYYSSVIETWQSWFVDAAPLVRLAGFFPTMGNHEYELGGDELAQYSERFFHDAGIDGNTDRYHFETGGVHFFTVNTENDRMPTSEQIVWLQTALEAARASAGFRFTILFFHRPTYTVGDSGEDTELRATLEPLLAPNFVKLVLAGHMHGYERFEVGGVTYLTTAGGGGVIGNVDANVGARPEDAALRVASGGFFHTVLVTIDGTTLTGEAIDDSGVVRDTFTHAVP